MGKDTDELFSELTKAKTDKELKTFYERNEEELQHPDAVACLEQLFAKHKLKKADVIFNTGLERTFSYHLGRIKENGLTKCIKTLCQAHFICSNDYF